MTKRKVVEFQSIKDDSGAVIQQVHALKARSKKDNGYIAIHLLDPSPYELEDAFCIAFRDNFDIIMIHSSKTWPSKTESSFTLRGAK